MIWHSHKFHSFSSVGNIMSPFILIYSIIFLLFILDFLRINGRVIKGYLKLGEKKGSVIFPTRQIYVKISLFPYLINVSVTFVLFARILLNFWAATSRHIKAFRKGYIMLTQLTIINVDAFESQFEWRFFCEKYFIQLKHPKLNSIKFR